MEKDKPNCPIAVIGMACKYPGANTPRELWENILSKRRQFRRMPDCRTPLKDYYHADPKKPDKTYLKSAAVIDGFNFDWKKRRIPYSTYQSTDIVHWLSLEVALKALADAGYHRKSLPGRRAGVIVGNTLTGEQTRAKTLRLRWPFVRRAFLAAANTESVQKKTIARIETKFENIFKSVSPPIDEDTLAGGLSNTIAGRICNYLDLGGGGYTVDGACSSSLIAIATAATGLMNRDLDLALAGGVDISLDPFEIIGFAKAGALTPDEMRVYDRRANGFLPGEGCGFVLLKRLEDAKKDKNDIYAILHGWGISSDGRGTSITAPNPKGQSRAIRRAYARAPFNINHVDFIEGHGTGTAVGDQVELEAISLSIDDTSIPGRDLGNFCGMTSLKSIVGHTKAAAGVGAFIKAVMAVNRRILPPTAGCQYPHPAFRTKALYPIITGKTISSNRTLRAGISAMGFGGINCHVGIESADPPSPKFAPSIKEQHLLASSQETELFILSGQTSKDLLLQIEHFSHEVSNISLAEMTDLAAELAKKSVPEKNFRAAVVANHPDQLKKGMDRTAILLEESPPGMGEIFQDPKNQIWIGNRMPPPRLGFLFPGQGAQQLNMAKRLITRYSWARNILTQADRLLARDDVKPISTVIYQDLDEELNSERSGEWDRILARTEYAQPAICLSSLIWLRWLEKIGVQPSAVGGHSLGELTAFYAAGAYDADTLIRFSGYRGQVFADHAENNGSMISLRCSKEKAGDLLNEVTGYATIANVNSPQQIVISGENRAIKQVSKLAADAVIPAFRLSVSGAFHSKLVSTTACVIENISFLPIKLKTPTCHLYNGMDGSKITTPYSLKNHFSKQILAPVNFINMIQTMSESCDLFIEVGPGQALSGMTNEINKGTGPFCLPVESKPGRDKDLNHLLAALFAHGIKINWDTVYEARFTRPFTPPSKRLFFENPCERHFSTPISVKSTIGVPATESLEMLFSGLGDISREKIEQYLKTRGTFISRIIQADFDCAPSETQWNQPSQKTKMEELDIPIETPQAKLKSYKSIDSVLLSTIELITGFTKDTLTSDMRLLDDLNLDSIKTGDLLTRVARVADIAGEIPPLDFANMTLGEITQNLNLIKSRQTTLLEPNKPDILKAVKEQIANLVSLSSSEINIDSLVEKDLKINKEQLKRLLTGLSDHIKVDIHVDLDPLLKRSLHQIASILQRLYDQQKPPLPIPDDNHRPPWTREFQVSLSPQPPPNIPINGKRQEDKWHLAHVLILTDNPENKPARAVAEKLYGLGARVDVKTHLSAQENDLMERIEYTHFVNILPNQNGESQSQYDLNLRDIITRLGSATAITPASRAPRRRNTLAYLQFGGGYFGTKPETAYLNQCCTTAIAATIHQERSDLRVRVLDFSPDLSPSDIAEKTVSEISTPDSFSAVGYDENLTRRERYQHLTEPANYKPRTLSWTKGDVILVTGGAKGITAECALGVARACGAKMALVGQSPAPKRPQGQLQIDKLSNTLKRYADLNLTARYYSCDISDGKAVKILVERINKEMGQITGIIHGAALNIPNVTNKVSIGEAIREVSPKVIGALNLMSAMDSMPPKLFIGLTSIIGITGLPGNAWYGFSNEALAIVLQRFEADHSNTRTLSVAYSIWQDEGMGARMGSVDVLKRQGISAIPTKEGVDRFVRLFFNDPGVHQVIVTARLSGLDTLKFKSKTTIKNARFLEKPLHITPGVESAFRIHLTTKRDPYLNDHKFEGSCLFPAVFGLEAMAQTVAHVTGIHDLGRVRIENIELTRPIIVDPEAGTHIIVWAEVEVQITDSALTIVRSGIYQPGINVNSDSFSATFIIGLNKIQPKYHISLPKKPLEINPMTDLYRETLLFQGPKFQRIRTVWSLESANDAGRGILTVAKK